MDQFQEYYQEWLNEDSEYGEDDYTLDSDDDWFVHDESTQEEDIGQDTRLEWWQPMYNKEHTTTLNTRLTLLYSLAPARLNFSLIEAIAH